MTIFDTLRFSKNNIYYGRVAANLSLQKRKVFCILMGNKLKLPMKFKNKNKYIHKVKENKNDDFLSTKRREQVLTPTDRLIYVYIVDTKINRTIEVVNVSYEVKIEEEWPTIIRYDSAHGYLHKHIRISLTDEKETTTRDQVKQKGDPKLWLTWAIKDIQMNFTEYRRLFFKRSKIVDNYF